MDAVCWKADWILTEEIQLPKVENEFWKRAKGKFMFIAGNKFIPVPVVWRNQRMRLLNRRLVGSTYRPHDVVFITKKEIDIIGMELEATVSREIKGSLEVRVGGKSEDIGTFAHIQDRVCWQGKQTVVHWGLYPYSKGRELWVIAPDVMSSAGYFRRPLLIKEKLHMWYYPQ